MHCSRCENPFFYFLHRGCVAWQNKGCSMAKEKGTAFFCKECGYESSKWMGQCPGCKEWNTLVEAPTVSHKKTGGSTASHSGLSTGGEPVLLRDVEITTEDRLTTGFPELDRVMGGGIVPGSLTLVGGDPGIGKSTLLLQVCKQLSDRGVNVLYVSGEESAKQIKMRGDRIGQFSENLQVLCETNLAEIEGTIRNRKPQVVVIDSIQTIYDEEINSAPGNVSQVREATAKLLQLAKGLVISFFIVGHVTKDGMVAGPRVLEHMVDTVLYFEGERQVSYRILRGVKNRFGSTNEIGVFEMCEEGLREVKNPSEYMLEGRSTDVGGSVVACSMEGTRPILIEIQALITKSNFGMPRRQATGIDANRVNLLMAVLERRMGLKLGDCDAYVNLAGGMRLSEPAMDLGIAAAIYSCLSRLVLDSKLVAIGEVGLSGEVRSVSRIVSRVDECEKLGFQTCIVPKASLKALNDKKRKLEIVGIENVGELKQILAKHSAPEKQ